MRNRKSNLFIRLIAVMLVPTLVIAECPKPLSTNLSTLRQRPILTFESQALAQGLIAFQHINAFPGVIHAAYHLSEWWRQCDGVPHKGGGLIPTVTCWLSPYFGGDSSKLYRWGAGPMIEEILGFGTVPLVVAYGLHILGFNDPSTLLVTVGTSISVRHLFVWLHPKEERDAPAYISGLNLLIPPAMAAHFSFSLPGLVTALAASIVIHIAGNIINDILIERGLIQNPNGDLTKWKAFYLKDRQKHDASNEVRVYSSRRWRIANLVMHFSISLIALLSWWLLPESVSNPVYNYFQWLGLINWGVAAAVLGIAVVSLLLRQWLRPPSPEVLFRIKGDSLRRAIETQQRFFESVPKIQALQAALPGTMEWADVERALEQAPKNQRESIHFHQHAVEEIILDKSGERIEDMGILPDYGPLKQRIQSNQGTLLRIAWNSFEGALWTDGDKDYFTPLPWTDLPADMRPPDTASSKSTYPELGPPSRFGDRRGRPEMKPGDEPGLRNTAEVRKRRGKKKEDSTGAIGSFGNRYRPRLSDRRAFQELNLKGAHAPAFQVLSTDLLKAGMVTSDHVIRNLCLDELTFRGWTPATLMEEAMVQMTWNSRSGLKHIRLETLPVLLLLVTEKNALESISALSAILSLAQALKENQLPPLRDPRFTRWTRALLRKILLARSRYSSLIPALLIAWPDEASVSLLLTATADERYAQNASIGTLARIHDALAVDSPLRADIVRHFIASEAALSGLEQKETVVNTLGPLLPNPEFAQDIRDLLQSIIQRSNPLQDPTYTAFDFLEAHASEEELWTYVKDPTYRFVQSRALSAVKKKIRERFGNPLGLGLLCKAADLKGELGDDIRSLTDEIKEDDVWAFIREFPRRLPDILQLATEVFERLRSRERMAIQMDFVAALPAALRVEWLHGQSQLPGHNILRSLMQDKTLQTSSISDLWSMSHTRPEPTAEFYSWLGQLHARSHRSFIEKMDATASDWLDPLPSLDYVPSPPDPTYAPKREFHINPIRSFWHWRSLFELKDTGTEVFKIARPNESQADLAMEAFYLQQLYPGLPFEPRIWHATIPDAAHVSQSRLWHSHEIALTLHYPVQHPLAWMSYSDQWFPYDGESPERWAATLGEWSRLWAMHFGHLAALGQGYVGITEPFHEAPNQDHRVPGRPYDLRAQPLGVWVKFQESIAYLNIREKGYLADPNPAHMLRLRQWRDVAWSIFQQVFQVTPVLAHVIHETVSLPVLERATYIENVLSDFIDGMMTAYGCAGMGWQDALPLKLETIALEGAFAMANKQGKRLTDLGTPHGELSFPSAAALGQTVATAIVTHLRQNPVRLFSASYLAKAKQWALTAHSPALRSAA